MQKTNHWMTLALEQAVLAQSQGEVPVGAVVCYQNEPIAVGYNRREMDQSAVAHAELLAIENACKHLGRWRLEECDLYVTLEPCAMCTGAIINSRIRTVYFGAYDSKAGCMGSVLDLTHFPFNHKPLVLGGIMEKECSQLLSDFFRQLRKRKKSSLQN